MFVRRRRHLEELASVVGRRGIPIVAKVEGARREVRKLRVADVFGPWQVSASGWSQGFATPILHDGAHLVHPRLARRISGLGRTTSWSWWQTLSAPQRAFSGVGYPPPSHRHSSPLLIGGWLFNRALVRLKVETKGVDVLVWKYPSVNLVGRPRSRHVEEVEVHKTPQRQTCLPQTRGWAQLGGLQRTCRSEPYDGGVTRLDRWGRHGPFEIDHGRGPWAEASHQTPCPSILKSGSSSVSFSFGFLTYRHAETCSQDGTGSRGLLHPAQDSCVLPVFFRAESQGSDTHDLNTARKQRGVTVTYPAAAKTAAYDFVSSAHKQFD